MSASIPVAVLLEIFTSCEKFRRERAYSDGHEEAERIVALASQYFDVVDFAIEPATRSALVALRGALQQCDDKEMRRHIAAAIRRGNVLLAEQIVEDPKLKAPPAAPAAAETLPATLAPARREGDQ